MWNNLEIRYQMKRTINKLIYLLFRHYYGGGTKPIAYESSIASCTFLILIHVLQIKVLIWGGGTTSGDNRLLRFLSISLYFIPVYLLLSWFFRRKDIIEYKYSGNLRKDYLLLVLYLLATFSILTLIILFKNNKL